MLDSAFHGMMIFVGKSWLWTLDGVKADTYRRNAWETLVGVLQNRTLPFIAAVFVMRFQWWRHQMETFSALLVICAENSPVIGEFPS